MTDKERLQEIEERYADAILNDGYLQDTVEITTDDYFHLKKQTEQVERLEDKITRLYEENVKLKNINYRAREVSREMHADLKLATRKKEEIEQYIEINTKRNAELNEFLQKRNTGNFLGLNVIEAVMKYVESLEKENRRYREVLSLLNKVAAADYKAYIDTDANFVVDVTSTALEEIK